MTTNTLNKEKIASILEPHAQHLADMKARGKSTSEMLFWLRSTCGWVLNPAQLERFLKQKESAAGPSSMACKTPPSARGGIATTAELEYQQLMSSPRTNGETAKHEKQDLKKQASAAPSSITAETPPMAPGGLAGLMEKFKQVLSRVMDQSDDKPDTLKVIDKMMHTVISYEQGKERLDQSARTLKIREEVHQRKESKPNNDTPVGDDVRNLIIPRITQDRSGRTVHDNPNTSPVEISSPGFVERLFPAKDSQQFTAAG